MSDEFDTNSPDENEIGAMAVNGQTSHLIANLPDFSAMEPFKLALEISDSSEAVHTLRDMLTDLIAQTDKSAPVDESARNNLILTAQEISDALPGAFAHWCAARLALAVRRGLIS